MSPTFATGFSEHPVAADATGEVIGQVAERLTAPADIVVLFVGAGHLQHFDSIAASMHAAIRPRHMIGASAVTVIEGGTEAEGRPGVSVWAASGLPVSSHHIDAWPSPDGPQIDPLNLSDASDAEGTLILLTEPFTFPVEKFLARTADAHPDLDIIGGIASASGSPGGNRLTHQGRPITSGAVALHIPADVGLTTVVSQGCRPVGKPFIITAAERNRVLELGGKPAMARLREMVNDVDDADANLIRRALFAGLVIDEQRETFETGDFLIRGLMGADEETGAIAINALAEVGTTFQFHVRDPASADDELRDMLDGRAAASALVFSCNGRGQAMFGSPDHDAGAIAELLDAPAAAGMFCAGEIGPVLGANHVHTWTAAIALFD